MKMFVTSVVLIAAAGLPLGGPAASADSQPPLVQMQGTDGCVGDSAASAPADGCADGRGLRGAAGMTISRDGRNVYVAAEFSDAVVIFARDALTGKIRQLDGPAGCVSDSATMTAGDGCADGRALDFVSAVTLSRDGRHAYAASAASDAVAVFDRDSDTGSLRQLRGTDGCISNDARDGCADGRALDGAVSVALSADGRYAYVTSFSSDAVSVFARDADSGALRQLDGASGCVSSDGRDGCTRGRALDGAFSVSSAANHVYVASRFSNAVATFSADPATGALSQLAGAHGCVADDPAAVPADQCADGAALLGVFGVTVAADGNNVYTASPGSSAVGVFARDRDSGVLRQLHASAGCISHAPAFTAADGCADGAALAGVRSLALSPDGQILYATSLGSAAIAVFDRDAASGALAQRPAPLGCIANGPPATQAAPAGDGCADARGLGGAAFAAPSTDGRSVYVSGYVSGTVASFGTGD